MSEVTRNFQQQRSNYLYTASYNFTVTFFQLFQIIKNNNQIMSPSYEQDKNYKYCEQVKKESTPVKCKTLKVDYLHLEFCQ